MRLELAKEDSTLTAQGEVATHKTSLTTFLTTGLELEERQYAILICFVNIFSNLFDSRRIITYDLKVLKKYKTQTQLADLEEKRRTLMMHINLWREAQLAYLPSTGSLVSMIYTNLLSEVQSSKESLTAEAIPLFLPSSLLPNQQPSPAFAKCLSCEVRLRIAQADDALADIRHYLRVISGFWQFKKVNISGTGNRPNTRMRTLFNRFNHRIQLSMLRYSAARACLLAADPMGEWNTRLKELKKSDVRGPGRMDFSMEMSDALDTSKGHFEISWIWLVQRPATETEVDASEQILDEGMRVEWSKSQARKMRWEEEVELLKEEMRRTIIYYEWKASWWLQLEPGLLTAENAIIHGVNAYAQKQAFFCKALAESFAKAWLPYMQANKMETEWGHRYSHLITNKNSNAIDPLKSNTMDNPESNGSSNQEKDEEEEDEMEDEEVEKDENYDPFELDD